MKTLKITEQTHLKLKKIQLYFNTKTLEQTLLEMIEDTAAYEFEYEKMNYQLYKELLNEKENDK